MTMLNVFALNVDLDVRHTNLSRAKGEAAALPPLADWLGVDSLDTDAIELFPVKDLDGMRLSDYVAAAFATEAIPAGDRVRLDALEGSVLLIPSDAIADNPTAKASELALVARLPLVRADHSANLPKAEAPPLPTNPPEAPPPPSKKPGKRSWLVTLIAMALLIGVFLLMVR